MAYHVVIADTDTGKIVKSGTYKVIMGAFACDDEDGVDAINMANDVDAITFLSVLVSIDTLKSTTMREIPLLGALYDTRDKIFRKQIVTDIGAIERATSGGDGPRK